MSVDEIAAAAGFCDRFHFSRIFKKQLGVGPARYRTQCSAQQGRG
jgi:transcriptional regulator GlxA family with amidase domain